MTLLRVSGSVVLAGLLMVALTGPFAAQAEEAVVSALVTTDDQAEIALPDPTVGPVTHLPMPRFVSLKSNEANVRRGPSLTHRIDWVFTRRDMPLQIVAEYGHWRRVIDRDGMGGWVHYAMLSGTRTVIIDQNMEPLYARPDERSPEAAMLEAGVIARIEHCDKDWCRLSTGGYRGWSPKTALWGVGPDEIVD